MANLYVVQASSEISSQVLERIKGIGDFIGTFGDNYLLSTDKSAKNIYEILTAGVEQPFSIFITKIDSKDYWGHGKKSLWDWIKKNKESQT